MITDQTIGSARAEQHKDAVAGRAMRNLITLLLASALTLPSLAARGMESSPKQAAAKAGDMLLLPPIPYLGSMPWIKWNTSAPTLRIDTLMSPIVTPWGIPQTPQDRAKALPAFA